MGVTVTVRFTDAPLVEHRRTYIVPAWGRWVLNLDELRPGFAGMADAVSRISCEGRCWADSAIYFEPIGRGVTASIRPILFSCKEATP